MRGWTFHTGGKDELLTVMRVDSLIGDMAQRGVAQ